MMKIRPSTLTIFIPTLLSLSVIVAATWSEEQKPATRFRDVLQGILASQYPLNIQTEAFNSLSYLPSQELLQSPQGARNAEDFMAQVSTSMKSVLPFDLYLKAKAQPASPVSLAQTLATLNSVSKDPQDRLTLIIIPGIFGEFIKTVAFQEAFEQKDSGYRKIWDKKLAEYITAVYENRADKSALSDQKFSLERFGTGNGLERIPVQKLLHVSSLDGDDGEPLVNIVLLDVPFMSMESLGDNAEKAQIALRRLNKFFQIMGPSANLAFLGYSRGSPVALEMMARAAEKPAEFPWIKNLKAMIALGGVVYGSDLADEALNAQSRFPVPATARQYELLKELNSNLHEIAGVTGLKKFEIVRANTLAWFHFVKEIAGVMKPKSGLSGTDWVNPVKIQELVTDLSRQFKTAGTMDMNAGIGLMMEIGVTAFKMDQPIAQYDPNVKRMKLLSSEILTGVRQLTSANRMNWWRRNVVPTAGITYYSLAGTMTDGATPGASEEQKRLATNPYAFNPELMDDQMLIGNYRGFRDASGISVNDSQVAAHKVRFWPEIHPLLNPAQPPISAKFLGIVGTHHWGLTLKMVNEPKAGSVKLRTNPFPRMALLEALAATVAADLPMEQQ